MKSVDKPWENEPDYEEFEHVGLQCAINRTEHIHTLYDYVGVDRDRTYKKDNYE